MSVSGTVFLLSLMIDISRAAFFANCPASTDRGQSPQTVGRMAFPPQTWLVYLLVYSLVSNPALC
jgi:hypothetical protein